MHSVMASNSTKLYLDMYNISYYDFSHMINNSYYEVSHNTEDGDEDQLDALYKSYIIAGIIIFIAGAFLSLWFLVAILRSQKVRSRLRNKIICNTFLLSLFDCLLVEPLAEATMWRLVHGHDYTCIHYSVTINLGFIQDFMENWILVMLLAIFIAQIQNVHPSGTFSQRTITVITSALLVLPWIVSLTVVPVALYAIGIRSGNKGHCLYTIIKSSDIAIFESIDTAIPLCLSLTLVIIAALLRHMRFSRGNSTDAMSIELISSGAETDSAYVYGIAVAVSIVCDFPNMIGSVILAANRNITHNYIEWHRFLLIVATMSKSRVVLLPLVWLLFPDIRQQIKTWRPWRRPPLGAEMIVTYRRQSD